MTFSTLCRYPVNSIIYIRPLLITMYDHLLYFFSVCFQLFCCLLYLLLIPCLRKNSSSSSIYRFYLSISLSLSLSLPLHVAFLLFFTLVSCIFWVSFHFVYFIPVIFHFIPAQPCKHLIHFRENNLWQNSINLELALGPTICLLALGNRKDLFAPSRFPLPLTFYSLFMH